MKNILVYSACCLMLPVVLATAQEEIPVPVQEIPAHNVQPYGGYSQGAYGNSFQIQGVPTPVAPGQGKYPVHGQTYSQSHTNGFYGNTGCISQRGLNCHQGCNSTCKPKFQLCPFGFNDHDYFAYRHQPECHGEKVYSILEAQKLNGQTAQMVFHNFHFNWIRETQAWELNQAGHRNLNLVAQLRNSTGSPILLSPSGDSHADQARLQLLGQMFAERGVTLGAGDLVVGAPSSNGIIGNEAILINLSLIHISEPTRPY